MCLVYYKPRIKIASFSMSAWRFTLIYWKQTALTHTKGIKIIKKLIENHQTVYSFLFERRNEFFKIAICKILPPTIAQRSTNCQRERKIIIFSIIESIKSWNSKGIICIIRSKKKRIVVYCCAKRVWRVDLKFFFIFYVLGEFINEGL